MKNFTAEKYPGCVVKLLTAAGFDTILSLSGIDEEKIKEIEVFLTSNKQFVNELKCCQSEWYKELEHFQFLPGHKAIILALPEKIKEMTTEKSKSKLCLNQNNSAQDEELKQHLIKNLIAFSGKAGFQLPQQAISEANIHEFERGSDDNVFVAKCRFSCPFCSKNYSVIYKKNWQSSNVTAHLRKHIDAQLHTQEQNE